MKTAIINIQNMLKDLKKNINVMRKEWKMYKKTKTKPNGTSSNEKYNI